MESKSFLKSKTVGVNATIAAIVAAATAFGWPIPPEAVAIATPIINVILRFMSSKKITL